MIVTIIPRCLLRFRVDICGRLDVYSLDVTGHKLTSNGLRIPGLVPNPKPSSLRDLLNRPEPLVVPGVVDALSGRLVEEAGFEACYVTGAGVSNVMLGLADVGLVTMTEVLEGLRRIVDAVSIPVLVDGDTGHGGPLSVMRTVHLFEQAGAAAIQLEDQAMPKRCGHFDGKRLVSAAEMQARIRAALAARSTDEFLVIARTDALAVEGLTSALRRAEQYRDAGADLLFVEAPTSREELETIGRELKGVPLVVNIVEGGRTPELSVAELGEMGFSLVLYANMLMRVMARAGQRALRYLAEHGETVGLAADMLSWEERQRLVNLPAAERLEEALERGNE